MHELDDEDREAVLLRFFQGCPLAEIGARLGIKENTARMRIERALEKLRASLVKRGITSTASVIAASLAGHAVSAAPAGMTVKIQRAAMAGTGVAAGGGLAMLAGKIAFAILVAAAVGIPLLHHLQSVHRDAARSHSPTVSEMSNNSLPANRLLQNTNGRSNPAFGSIASVGPNLDLYLDDPKTGKPVANVVIDDRCWSKSGFLKSQFHTDKNGWCEVTYPSNVTELELTTRLDGYADTRLDWHMDRGEKIPLSYTLHLDKAVPIGGEVLDENGMPVADAKVGWNHEDDPLTKSSPESHEFGWIEVTTDAGGHWQINRNAGDMIRRIYGSARDSDYVDSPMVFAGRDATVEKALREGTYVFKLGNAATIEGNVVDSEGRPVPDAKLMVGYVSESGRRESTASVTGTFIISGCPFGDNLLTASAPGFANTTKEINITTNSPLYEITLTKGKVLKLLVQNRDGTPIPHASAWLDALNQGPVNSPHFNVKRTQVDFNEKSDSNGRIVWSNAPDGELKFQFFAPGYVRSEDFYFTADGEEHIVMLNLGLIISGTVRDADSGELIPHFKMGIGWPEQNYQTGQTNGHWSSIARFWPEFSGGTYSNSLEEAAIGGTSNPGYVLKFEADGYGAYVSRVIAPDEGHVQLDVSLHREISTPISVIAPDDQPTADADVGLVSLGAQLRLLPGGFSRSSSSASLLRTDDAGHFTLPSDDSISRVIVASPSGYAETTPADLRNSPTITLQPWGRIEATCFSGGQPVAGREYLFGLADSTDDDDNAFSVDFTAFRVTSDEQGKFTMPMVPPGKHSLVRLIPESMGPNQKGWMHGDKTEVDIQPGATTTVTLGDKGYTVTANLQWPDGAQPTNLMNVMIALHTPMPPLPPEIAGHQDLIQQYYKSPEFQAIAKTAHSYPMAMNADGTLAAEDVPPGNYKLSAFVILQAQAGKPNGSMSAPEISITIPSDPPTGKLDAGTITLREMPVH